MEHLELTKEQYLATMHTPMRFIELGDKSDNPFPIGDYVENLIKQLDLPTTRKEIQIHAVYMNDKKGILSHLVPLGLGQCLSGRDYNTKRKRSLWLSASRPE
jgi:hypothetical protein